MRFLSSLLLAASLHLAASHALAQSLLDGYEAYDRGDYANALQNFKPLAEQGDANAQLNLGFMYDEGKGVPQSYTKAVEWYRRAAEQGYVFAQFSLGEMFDEGEGVPQSYTKAVEWYRRAAEQGYADAQYSLSVLYDRGQGVRKNMVMVYILASLAAAQGQESAKENRDISLNVLSREQIAEGQRLASEWQIGTPLPTPRDVTTWP